MRLVLKRTTFTKNSTIGELSIDGRLVCHVLEDVVRPAGQKVFGKTAIPAGTYDIIVNLSNRFRVLMPLLLKVRGFEGVRIHAGNTEADTLGCLLVGTYDPRKPDFVSNSRQAYAQVLARINAALAAGEPVTITIS